MMTRDLIYRKIDLIEDIYLDDLHQLITQFVHSKQTLRKPGLMAKLRQIKIDAPEDFAANIDLYISGEKHAHSHIS
ncbi:MAG: hypothetical protein AB7S75_13115 [Desulfococcaceae bacterium]